MSDSSNVSGDGASPWRVRPIEEQVHRIRDLIEYCRNQGYRRDEVIRIIEELP
jgi:hypothetical protein